VKHLERDGAIVLEIVGKIDRGHAAAPEFAFEAVAVGQGGPKVIDGGVGQSGSPARYSTRLALRFETD
jgi:hypothetical protein